MKQCHLLTSTTFISQEKFENILSNSFDLVRISVTDLFMAKLRNEPESELAIKIKESLKSAELVPTELIAQLIKEKLIGINNGLLFTGYPRTKEQLNSLSKILTESGFKINRLWILELQNIEKLISEHGNKDAGEQIREKFKLTVKQNKEIAELINTSKITSKMNFNYPIDWTTDKIKARVKAMHNTVYKT